MLTSPLNIEELESCTDLLQRAKHRKHPQLKFDEFKVLRDKYRTAHWCPDDKPSGFTGHMGYSLAVNRLADPALDQYLKQCGIVVLPAENPEHVHPYEAGETTGLDRVKIVERKAKLSHKLAVEKTRLKMPD